MIIKIMFLLIDKMLLFFTRKYVAIASGSRRIAASILPLIALGKTNASRRTASEDIVMLKHFAENPELPKGL